MKSIDQIQLFLGDCALELKNFEDNSIDLIFTSPPYADSRKNTYGGIHPDDYVEWFLPISRELLRCLKPSGTFILNIKEKVVNGERHTYVIDLIKEILILGNGQIDLGIHGKDLYSLTKISILICTRKK